MTVESRIANIRENASEILRVLELQLAGRVVYLNRAPIAISMARDTIEVMRRTEAAGVESDFTPAWHTLRERLADAQTRFEEVIASADCATQPCRVYAR